MHQGNPNLRTQYQTVEYTKEDIEEILKCKNDFFYFCENYAYIINDGQRQLFAARQYQKDLISDFIRHKFICAKWPRQSGKSTIISAYIAWLTIFNDLHNTLIAAHQHKTAIEIMGKVKEIIENLPLWMQEGIVSWNQLEIELENGSRVKSAATTKNAARGFSYQFVLLDEFAFVDPNIANEFFTSIYPTLAQSKNGKMAIISTPNGMNHFHKLCIDSEQRKTNFKYSEIHWTDIPGRDVKFKEDTIKNIGEDRWIQEFEAEFMGGEDTMISPRTLRNIVFIDPLEKINEGRIQIFKPPVKGNNYVITVDPSRGKGIDASSFIVFDITKYPVEIVATYRDNEVTNTIFPGYINRLGTVYNNATVLVEINDNGQQIADILFDEYEYTNLLGCVMKGRNGQQLTTFGPRAKGLKQSEPTKRVGCANVRAMIDDNKIIVNSHDIVSELSNFVRKGGSYAARTGEHDDLVMCMVLFGWMTTQKYYKEYVETGIREIYSDALAQAEEDMLPIGIYDDGDGLIIDDEPLYNFF